MVSVTEDSEGDDKAKCVVRKFNNPHEICNKNNDKFECYIDKNKTVRQFVHIVAQYYSMDVDSFYLTFSSYKFDPVSDVQPIDKVLHHLNVVFFRMQWFTIYISAKISRG